ncbi:MAG TPA: ATP-binding protein [Casimicrobiaceae bacterium]
MTPADDFDAADERLPHSLAGSGRASELMQTRDWHATPLGPPDGWPQSLRTSVGICLDSRFPIVVWWGRDLVMIYNDDYAPMLGAKHPAAFGGIGREVWSDIWAVVGPMLDSVMVTGVATQSRDLLLVMERNGYAEEAYFSFSYSPIRDENGAVGGIFTPVVETTERVVGERRLRTLRDLAARSMGTQSAHEACVEMAEVLAQNPRDVPFALIYLFNGDGTSARFCASAGVDGKTAFAPARLDADSATWPLTQLQTGSALLLDELQLRFARSDIPTGAWSDPPRQALLLPIALPGRSQPIAALVLGVNPRRALDAEHRAFHDLVAAQVTAALADATAFEEERHRTQALAELDKAKTDFFSNVSHEFRTPLTLMLGALDESDRALAQRDPGPAIESVAAARRSSLRLLRLVNHLLDFARIAAARMQPRFEATDLCAFTAELASSFRSVCESAGLALDVRCEPPLDKTYIDRGMWEKIVLNLLSNAFKFTFEGGIAVTLSRAHDERTAVLTVADTGTGIAAEEIPRLFDRFHRVPGAKGRSFEGSGIGLALVSELVSLHGGTVSVTSIVGRGSAFTVSIPLGASHLPHDQVVQGSMEQATASATETYVAEATQWLSSRSDESAGPSPATSDGGTVLVADDNRDMREYLTRLLADHWRVTAVADGAAALTAIGEHRPDVVLADVMMPVVDGIALLRTLRADPQTATLPVVLLSARAGEEARLDGLRRGASDYLIKPFSAREVIARVQAQITQSRIRSIEETINQRLADVFRNAPVGICLLRGPGHVYEFVNDAYRTLVAGRDVLGKPIREALPELEGQGIFELLDDVYGRNEAHVGRSHKVLLREPNGALDERYFDFVYQPLPAADGNSDIAVVAFDVTELAHARREAETANRAKDVFLAMLSHELRNPLGAIVTALHVMKRRGAGTLEEERAIVTRQVDRLVRLVGDLLDVSRLTRGKIDLERTRVELADVVTTALETARPLIEKNQHELVLDVPASGLAVDADALRLSQIVANLLTNAAKFTPPSGTIRIAASCEADDVVLQVSDNGAGIASDLVSQVFNVFVQGEQSLAREHGGLGLGLTISRALAEQHGGRLTVESAGIGKGSTFTLRLPAARMQTPILPMS